MNWIEIPDNIPEGEVLAANFKPRTYGYKEKNIGYLQLEGNGTVTCDGEGCILENCTHYIDINKFDPV